MEIKNRIAQAKQAINALNQGFSNCGMRTTSGTWKVVRWYAIKFIKILNLRVK